MVGGALWWAAPRRLFRAEYKCSAVSTAGASSMPCFSSQTYPPWTKGALPLLRARLRRTSSPEPFKIPNCPHEKNTEANYSPDHKKGLSNIACHFVLPTFVESNSPTYFLVAVLYTDIKRQCVIGRPTSLIGINRRWATRSPPSSCSSVPT